MNKYTVILTYPMRVCETNYPDTYMTHVLGTNRNVAVQSAKEEAAKANDRDIDPEEFEEQYVFPGFLYEADE